MTLPMHVCNLHALRLQDHLISAFSRNLRGYGAMIVCDLIMASWALFRAVHVLDQKLQALSRCCFVPRTDGDSKSALERKGTHMDVQHTSSDQTSIRALEDRIKQLLSAIAHRYGSKRCQQARAEMAKRPYSRVAQQAKFVSQLDAARLMWQSALHSFRMGGEHNVGQDSKRLRLLHLQALEQERHMARRLDVTLHQNQTMWEQVANLRDKVLRDRDQCSALLEKHSVLTEAADQYTRSLQLENEIRSQCRFAKQKLADTRTNCERNLQQMKDNCGVLTELSNSSALQDMGAMQHGMQLRDVAMGSALGELAAQAPSGKIVEVLRIILEGQQSSFELFDRVHRLDVTLQAANLDRSRSN